MNKYVAVWVNVCFEKENDFMYFDEDFTESANGTSEKSFEQILGQGMKGEHYATDATKAAQSLGIKEIEYVWYLFDEPESNSSEPYIFSAEQEQMSGVIVIKPGQAAYLGHFAY